MANYFVTTSTRQKGTPLSYVIRSDHTTLADFVAYLDAFASRLVVLTRFRWDWNPDGTRNDKLDPIALNPEHIVSVMVAHVPVRPRVEVPASEAA